MLDKTGMAVCGTPFDAVTIDAAPFGDVDGTLGEAGDSVVQITEKASQFENYITKVTINLSLLGKSYSKSVGEYFLVNGQDEGCNQAGHGGSKV